jgi:hypothetical protein
MSELFFPLTPEQTLEHIQDRLSQGAGPALIIEELLPRSRDAALSWARRLAGWEENQPAYPAQVIALARLVSLRAMREYDLMLREDGRVVDRPRAGSKPWKTPKPALTFRLDVGGEEVCVAYTPGYFSNSGTDNFYFVSPHEPPQPHFLSETGFWSQFVLHDAVKAAGGPQAYAAQFADAVVRGEAEKFTAALEGVLPEAGRTRCGKAPRPGNAAKQPPPPGEHAARVIAKEDEPKRSPKQGMLF